MFWNNKKEFCGLHPRCSPLPLALYRLQNNQPNKGNEWVFNYSKSKVADTLKSEKKKKPQSYP